MSGIKLASVSFAPEKGGCVIRKTWFALPDTDAKGVKVRREKQLLVHFVHAATLTTHHILRIWGTRSPVRGPRFGPRSRPVDDCLRAGYMLASEAESSDRDAIPSFGNTR